MVTIPKDPSTPGIGSRRYKPKAPAKGTRPNVGTTRFKDDFAAHDDKRIAKNAPRPTRRYRAPENTRDSMNQFLNHYGYSLPKK